MDESRMQNRRDFIKVLSLSGAGLILAPRMSLNGIIESSVDDAAHFSPSVFITILPSGQVTITIPRSELGQGVFTSLPMLVAEELEIDWKEVKVEQTFADKRFGDQNTGGSTSIRKKWEPLRVAGATARTMLVNAAAARWNVAPSVCTASMGKVRNSKSGDTLSYGELAESASRLTVPQDVKLKDPKEFKIIGKKVARLDSPAKVYGEARFGIDQTLPGMCYATVQHFPVFGGGIKNIDASKTKGLRGVIGVAAISTGVAVVAESTWLAFKGMGLLSVDWDAGPNVRMSSESLHQMLAERLTEASEELTRVGKPVIPGEGEKNLQAIYEVPYLAHATMEPMNCLAHFKDGKVEIWAPTQDPQGIQAGVGRALGLKEEDVTVHVVFSGGAFGRRCDFDFAVEACEISKHIGRPVKLTWTREEDIRHDFYRPASIHELEGTVDKNGKPTSLQHHIITSSIEAFKSGKKLEPHNYDFKGAALERAYKIPFMKLSGSVVEAPVPLGYWRSVYRSQNPFALESFIDEMAVAAGRDPFEFRKDMLPEDSRLRNVLTVAAERAEWHRKLERGRGKGIACVSAYDSYCAYAAEVTVDSNGRLTVDRFVAAVDCGMVVNPDTVEAQIQGCVAFALTAALKGNITFQNGGVVESNFDSYPILTYDEMPTVDVHIIQNSLPVGGIGELGIGPCAPALCNAIFSATGKRIRKLPVNLNFSKT